MADKKLTGSITPETRAALDKARAGSPNGTSNSDDTNGYKLSAQQAAKLLEKEENVKKLEQAGVDYRERTKDLTEEEKNIIGVREYQKDMKTNPITAMAKAWFGGYGPAMQKQSLAGMGLEQLANSTSGLAGAILTFATKTGISDGFLNQYTHVEDAIEAGENLGAIAQSGQTPSSNQTLATHSHGHVGGATPKLPQNDGSRSC